MFAILHQHFPLRSESQPRVVRFLNVNRLAVISGDFYLDHPADGTMWDPQTIASWFIIPITMVYQTYNYSQWGLETNL